ncbi:MAG TPA: extracellular solute-binding protein [Candidatus Limiplasma sp.]|nr:extracellular solute-binding protein [Candidatus Limiplasma sp.]HPR77135.1 extracellular solute-binding protein [Candidatus Limiplasma sp.]
MKKFVSILLTLAMLAGMATVAVAEAPREAQLNVMMSFPQYMDQWESYAKQFEAKMLAEQNVKVTVNIEMPSSDQYDSVLQARLTGDDAPDLYTLHCNNIGVYNKAGYLTDLTSQPLSAKLYDNVRATVTVDGKVMAVPIESMAWGVLYNKDIFEKAGVAVPETLTDLKTVCATLKDKGYTPFMLAFQEQWVPQLMTALTLGGLVSGEKTDWLSRMYEDKGSYDEVRSIFDVIDVIIQNGTERAMEEGSQQGAADFANGKAAMFVQGTWAASTIMETNPDMKLGVFALPVNDDTNCTRVDLSTSTTLAVYPGTKEMDLALAFANYVLDDTDSSALFEACGFNPIASCHTFQPPYWVADATQYVSAGRSFQDLVLPNAVTDEQGKLLQEYYVGSVTVDQIVEQLDKAFQEANKVS